MTTNRPTILFDFDGTLAETMMLIHAIFNRLSSVYGYRYLPEDEIEACRELSVYDFLVHSRVPVWKIPMIAIHARKLMHRDINQMQPPAGLVEALTKIHKSGRYRMDILTSNRRKNVLKFLADHAIGWFDEVHATHSILSKKRGVKKYMRQRGIAASDLVYVGDTSVDVESARMAGVKVVAVTWGLNTAAALGRLEPDYMIDTPSQLLDIFS